MGKTVQFQGENRPGNDKLRRCTAARKCCARGRIDPGVKAGVLLPVLLIAGCSGPQSTLSPAGRGAEQIATLFWWMAGGAAVVWLIVMGLALSSIINRTESGQERRMKILIIGGGVTFPTIVLTVLLIYGLRALPELTASAPEGSLRIAVTGEQWWWRVRYQRPEGGGVSSANEIRLPVGEPVEFILDAPDVIHSFWIPALGGKMDMIPGRVTRLTLHPTRTGVFRGQCAEYCGTSHAWMAFDVVVQEKEEFEAWLAGQATPAREPVNRTARRGAELFQAHGCGACHTIRGTGAAGVVGPDLTHVGSRLTIAAGTLANEREQFQRWITHPKVVKPGAHMPHFGMLPEGELNALAAYLEALE